MRRILLILTLILVPFSVQAEPGKTFHSESFTLKNGMQVVVIPNHRVPVVTHMVWYKIGAADEPFGQSGMAHYFEHLMFKGTKKQAPGEFSRVVSNLGGEDNAFTSQDYTAYFQSVPVDKLETMMKMEADRMVNLAPPPEHFASEKAVVLEERRQRKDNDPRSLFFEQLDNAFYVNHPYGIPVIGWLNEIERYEWDDVKVFYDTWYAPNNAVLVVSGDITAEELLPMAERTYGRVTRKDVPERIRPHVPPLHAETVVTLQDPSIRQPIFTKMFLAPSHTQNPQDSYGLEVLAEILDGNSTTRLYKSLVKDQKKATSVSFGYASNKLNYSDITISATPADGVSLDTLDALIEKELRNVIDNGVTEEEVDEAIKRLQDEAIFARDSVSGPARIFGYMLATGSTVEDVESWPENIGLVSPTIVQEVARKYLNTDEPWIRAPVTGHLLPGGAQ